MAATVNEIFLEDLWAREGSNTNWKYSIPYLDKGWTFLKLRIRGCAEVGQYIENIEKPIYWSY